MSEEPSMPLIRPAALSAAELAAQEAAAAKAAAREALVVQARCVVEALPAPPDGSTPLAGHGDELEALMVDVDAVVVVLTDGDVALMVHADRSEVRLVELVDDRWTRRSEPVADLAELGRLIDEASG